MGYCALFRKLLLLKDAELSTDRGIVVSLGHWPIFLTLVVRSDNRAEVVNIIADSKGALMVLMVNSLCNLLLLLLISPWIWILLDHCSHIPISLRSSALDWSGFGRLSSWITSLFRIQCLVLRVGGRCVTDYSLVQWAFWSAGKASYWRFTAIRSVSCQLPTMGFFQWSFSTSFIIVERILALVIRNR